MPALQAGKGSRFLGLRIGLLRFVGFWDLAIGPNRACSFH